ncbi:hypothetical protein K490DRAFT_73530 [Saccharata proteae CBS 121410]|uniref:PH domain-containing protein n=1 Tax=Saccharata proteae CBS 121410 TaxID=1314787 RepID=A0A9P4HXW8_9PEZI|nr:hypothetical protein K490DRAFT_73530 [Saccharata proteae CBS 121410]
MAADASGITGKLSRYRSVRKAQQQQQDEAPPPLPTPAVPADQTPSTMSQSMSRYHRQRLATSSPAPPVRRAGTQHQATQSSHAHAAARQRAQSTPGKRVVSNDSRPTASQEPSLAAREEARMMLEGETDRQQRMKAKLDAEKQARLEELERVRAAQQAQEAVEAERAQRDVRILQEKERRAEALRLRQEAAQAKATEARRQDEAVWAIERERPRTAKQRTNTQEDISPRIPSVPDSPSTAARMKDKLGFLKLRKEEHHDVKPRQMSRDRVDDMQNIKQGGGGAVPGIDAPISAVNAGDRRVLVECNNSTMLLPVTPTTTPLDLIRSASTCMSEPINAKASVMLEVFSKAGVQRPLRNYEHDTLLLVDSPTGGNDKDLSANSVPEEKPEGFSACLYYSQKPGKWSKRWITLRSDGQMVVAKDENGKDTSNVCHMSDFDIYTPTARSIAKKVKPPKKVCFAIKSQQKSSMFISTSSYVHFFCTNDKTVATEFYTSVQGWRSWYLVHVMGEGQTKSRATEAAAMTNLPGARKGSTAAAVPGHARGLSIESHYQLGSFKPLLDMGQFETPELTSGPSFSDSDTNLQAMHSRKMSLRNHVPPPSAFPSRLVHADNDRRRPSQSHSLTRTVTTSSDDEGTFAPNTLLGRAYSQRQKKQRERDLLAKQSPFTDGPSLLATYDPNAPLQSSLPTRMPSTRSTRGARPTRSTSPSALTRGPSRRRQPQPLVDLTPQYREPPQHVKKGKGFHPEQIGPGGLIDSATSPEVPIPIPPAQDWRGRGRTMTLSSRGEGSGSASRSRTGPGCQGQEHQRTKSLRVNHGHTGGLAGYASNNHDTVPIDSDEAFTGGGLLGNADTRMPLQQHRQMHTGHGVMDGSKARGPMLDVSEKAEFVKGSLLYGVAAREGGRAVVVDREGGGV